MQHLSHSARDKRDIGHLRAIPYNVSIRHPPAKPLHPPPAPPVAPDKHNTEKEGKSMRTSYVFRT